MGFRFFKGLTFLSSLFLVLACKIHVPNPELVIDGGASLACVTQVNGNLFAPGQPVTITVSGQNGSAPYSISGIAGNFATSTTVVRSYSNITSRQIVVSDQFALSDSAGNTALCTFNVNITSVVIDPTPLACQMVGTPQNALVGQNVSFNITASGGSGSFTMSNFQGGNSSSVVTPLLQNGNTAVAAVNYSTAGTKTASVMVQDSNGNVATCSDDTVVNAAASVAVLASPAKSVSVGSSIMLTATPSGFSSTPTLTFATTQSGVTITMLSANSARVDATDNSPHSNFTVTVTASNGSQSATNSDQLSFTAVSSLSCSISYNTANTYRVDDIVNVNVVASNNETLNITYFSAPGATEIPSFVAFPKPLKYSTAGTKYLYAQAKSATTGQLCNNGAVLQTTVNILPATTSTGCTVVTGANPSYAGQYFTVSATPTTANGYQRIYIIDATNVSTGSQPYGQWHYGSSPLSARAVIYVPGTYNLTVTILDDLTNTTSSCVTQQVIY